VPSHCGLSSTQFGLASFCSSLCSLTIYHSVRPLFPLKSSGYDARFKHLVATFIARSQFNRSPICSVFCRAQLTLFTLFLDVGSARGPAFYPSNSRLTASRPIIGVTVSKEEGDCIVYLEIRANKLIRHLVLGKLTNYRVVRTSLELLHTLLATALSK
jgi:hypothetical protein